MVKFIGNTELTNIAKIKRKTLSSFDRLFTYKTLVETCRS